MEKAILAVDQGTTSTRAMLFDHAGHVLAVDQLEHQQYYPQPGWVEHDPLEIWRAAQAVIRGVLKKVDLSRHNIEAIGVTNQRETVVVWDRETGIPLCPAIVWQDTRTDQIIQELSSVGGQDRYRAKTGLPLATYFSGPKLRWILENVPGARKAAEEGRVIFGNIDSWIIWNLTGGVDNGLHLTDVTNASRTLMMNLATLEWDDEIIAQLGIPIAMLPKIYPSAKVYGTAKGELDGTPIASDLGDQQAALFGQACYQVGETKNTYGTGCFMLMNTGTQIVPSHSGLLTTVAYQLGQQPAVYCLEGSIAITGALVQWLRDNLKIISRSAEVEDLARSVDDAGGIYFVPAFSGLFAPYWRSDARGVIVGMTRHTNRGHLARAVLEATAYQTREVLAAMEKDSGISLKMLKVDGGMVYNELLMQFQADIIDVPVIRPKVAETTALGAAYAAGLATGYWRSLDDLRDNWVFDKAWRSQISEAEREACYRGWKKAVIRSLGWIETP
jgi:glycerol kinase